MILVYSSSLGLALIYEGIRDVCQSAGLSTSSCDLRGKRTFATVFWPMFLEKVCSNLCFLSAVSTSAQRRKVRCDQSWVQRN